MATGAPIASSTATARSSPGTPATASATMLALMLTMLSFTRSTDSEFGEDVYRRVYRVSVMATLSLVGAVTLLLILTIPVQEMEGVPPNFFEILYNVLFALVTVCCALVVASPRPRRWTILRRRNKRRRRWTKKTTAPARETP